MRRQIPDKERPFRLPGGHVIPFLGFWSSNMIVYWTGWETNLKLFLAVLLGFGLLIVTNLVHRAGATRTAGTGRPGPGTCPGCSASRCSRG